MNSFYVSVKKPPSPQKKPSKRVNTGITFYIFVLITAVMVILLLYLFEPKPQLVSGGEYAELLINTVDSMDLPYEIKINLMQINDANELLDEINKSLNGRSKVSKDKHITREQCAYMTDFFLRYISVNYEPASSVLTFVPEYINKTVYEKKISRNIANKKDKLQIDAYYLLLDEVYILDNSATDREKRELLTILNNHNTIVDGDIIKMNMEYGILQRHFNVVSLEPLYLEELPDMENINEPAKIVIENAYIKTTLAENVLTQTEYEYIIQKYREKYNDPLPYRQLKDESEIAPEQKKEIQNILNDFPEFPEIERDNSDKYEKFDEEYDIPAVIASDKFNDIVSMLSYEDRLIFDEYYTRTLINSFSDIYELPSDDKIIIYILRNDLTAEEELRIETYKFEALGKRSAAFLEIYSQIEYDDIAEVSSWARESVEMLCKTNIMTGAETDSFMPSDDITQEETEKIINNIIYGFTFY